MSGSNRGILSAFAGLAAAAALYFLVTDLATVSASIEQSATHRADKYGKDAGSYVDRRCLRLAFPASEDCARQAEQAARENQRVELDLAAQGMTAWWTQVMGVAALIGMALSAIGVWLVWTTFREAQRSADAAARSNEIATENLATQLRPWLTFDGVVFKDATNTTIDGVRHANTIMLSMRWTNTGQSPAKKCFIWRGFAIAPFGANEIPTFEPFQDGGTSTVGVNATTGSPWVGIGGDAVSQWLRREIEIIFCCCVFYQDSLPPFVDRMSIATMRVARDGDVVEDGKVIRPDVLIQAMGAQNDLT